jgi:hypothetical protein
MSESVGSSEFLLGIEEYLRFLNKEEQANSLHAISKTIDAPELNLLTVKSFMQNLCRAVQEENKNLSDLLHGIVKTATDVDVCKPVLQYVGKTLTSDKNLADLSLAIQRALDSENFENNFIQAYLSMLDRQFLTDKIFRGINNYLKLGQDRKPLNDAFSRSQLKSKIWLIEELDKVRLTLKDTSYYNVAVFAGWFGQIKSVYDKRLTFRKMRIIELDKTACETSDYIFNLSNLEEYKVKSVHADINNLTLHKNGYEWEVENFKEGTKYNEKFLPDLIINTSAEHMTEDWFFQIKFKQLESNPIIAIQSNNLFDISEHVNCVHSVEHMKKKFPMSEILFEGELQLKGYKRVMLIGRP